MRRHARDGFDDDARVVTQKCALALPPHDVVAQQLENRNGELMMVRQARLVALEGRKQHHTLKSRIRTIRFQNVVSDGAQEARVIVPFHASLCFRKPRFEIGSVRGVIQHGLVQRLLVRKMTKDNRFGHPGSGCNLFRRRALKSFTRKEIERRLEQLLPPVGGGHAAGLEPGFGHASMISKYLLTCQGLLCNIEISATWM